MSTALSSSSLSPPCHGGSYREGVWTIARRKTSQRAMDSEHVTVCKRVCPDFLTIREILSAHIDHGTDASEGEDHDVDQRPVAQAHHGRGIDTIRHYRK